ncbi:S-formylglutathione hydrolase [Pleionea sp. CnH1-48]|uniref:S-formylglutathione hydrolase n=1 Tax=Pleionea sp. CnH1-48 TaxID=2954494 RepID=UPI00209785D8|nr:S-formylglutathione hydrolase [Pleionea sp. CnH1-48]MCO7225961.1 S-formylglutathione hydrolase [Pleionea sp. CnH1-48]
MNLLSKIKCFEGHWHRYQHASQSCQCDMTFSIFLPPQSEQGKVPVLYWLSGLTCSDENFVQKAHAESIAAELGMAIVVCDTSPRGCNIEGEDDDWDFGSAAGFYLNATQKPWSNHYRMYDYVVDELWQLVNEHFPVDANRAAIAGHSMGGHGALTIALKNPQQYRSVSAFAPICAPMECAWGEKAFTNYLGPDRDSWSTYDACQLIKSGHRVDSMLVEQGEADGFLAEQLLPEKLQQACESAQIPLKLNRREGYDHSYFFIASFIESHFRYHAAQLSA